MQKLLCLSICFLATLLHGQSGSFKVTNNAAIYYIKVFADGDISLSVETEREPTEFEVTRELKMVIRDKIELGITRRPMTYYENREIRVKSGSLTRVQGAFERFDEWTQTAIKEELPSVNKVIDDIDPESGVFSRLKLEFRWHSEGKYPRSALKVSTGGYYLGAAFEPKEIAQFQKLLSKVPKLEEQAQQEKKELEEKKAKEKAEKERIDKLLK